MYRRQRWIAWSLYFDTLRWRKVRSWGTRERNKEWKGKNGKIQGWQPPTKLNIRPPAIIFYIFVEQRRTGRGADRSGHAKQYQKYSTFHWTKLFWIFEYRYRYYVIKQTWTIEIYFIKKVAKAHMIIEYKI